MYVIQALVVRADCSNRMPPGLQMVPLDGGCMLIPLDTSARERLAIPFLPMTDDGASMLPENIIRLGELLGATDRVAYIEAAFFGGPGMQASAVFYQGRLVAPPLVDEIAINAALRELGVVAMPGKDEFDVVGLGKFRETDKWLAVSRLHPSH